MFTAKKVTEVPTGGVYIQILHKHVKENGESHCLFCILINTKALNSSDPQKRSTGTAKTHKDYMHSMFQVLNKHLCSCLHLYIFHRQLWEVY